MIILVVHVEARFAAIPLRLRTRLVAPLGGTLRTGPARLPRAMGHDAGENDAAQRSQRDRQRAQMRSLASGRFGKAHGARHVDGDDA
jgi:hypothetical protein